MSSKPRAPDLQEWIARYGSYVDIDWHAWHQANAEYQRARRDELLRELEQSKQAPRRRGAA